jgi:hypothetical protein
LPAEVLVEAIRGELRGCVGTYKSSGLEFRRGVDSKCSGHDDKEGGDDKDRLGATRGQYADLSKHEHQAFASLPPRTLSV